MRASPEAGHGRRRRTVSWDDMSELTACADPAAWDAFVSRAADGSLLQSWGWGSLRSRYGWEAARLFWTRGGRPCAAISVLRRRLPGGLALHYAPRGPVLDGRLEEWPGLWQVLRARLAENGGTLLKLDPEWTTDEGRRALEAAGGRPSRHPVQHQASLIVDLSGGDDVLRRVKESTRRNIRAGERHGITVEASEASSAMDLFYGLLQETAARRNFTIRPRAYYQDLLGVFRERGQVGVYLARHEGQLLAGAVMMFYGPTLIYLFGGTSAAAEPLKPAYLLHWRAIEDAQRRGCTHYDMWGIPLNPEPAHPGYGYYVFKSRFNGRPVRYIGLYDLPVNRPLALTVRLAERLSRAGQPEFV